MGKKKLSFQKIRISKLDNLHNIKGGTGDVALGTNRMSMDEQGINNCMTAGNDCNTVAQSDACERDGNGGKGNR